MSTPENDRNLLVGMLALQMDLVNQQQLITAMQAWVLQKSEQIEDILLQQGSLNAEAQAFLTALAAKHLELHSNDVEKSLAALSSIESVSKRLADLDDAEIDQTLNMVAAIRDETYISSLADTEESAVEDERDSEPIGERFRILRPHAHGGLGQVSVAEDRELHREVALKEIRERYADDVGSRMRFQIEAEVTGQLEHPGIVPVYSLGKTPEGRPFYVMRFIKGDSLKDAVQRLHSDAGTASPEVQRLLLRKLIRRLVDVCNAIEYAHSRGVLHRDLKPGNIMLGRYGETLVVDWGLAKTVGRSGDHEHGDERTFVPQSADSSTETRLGTVVGTLAYMSPEQADGRIDELGPAADVYCLGATLYTILTGVRPVPKGSETQMLNTIRTGAIKPAQQVVKDVDLALAAICRRAMAVNIPERYPTAASLADELELWLADEPVSAYTEPLPQRVARFIRRHRTAAMTVASFVVVSVIALSVISGIVTSKNRELTKANTEILEQSEQIRLEQERVTETRDEFRRLAFEVLDSAEKKMASVPGVETFRRDVMEKSFETFRQLHEHAPDDLRVTQQLATSARLSGNHKARIDDAAGALERLTLSVRLQKELLDSAEDQETARNYLVETLRDLAAVQRKLSLHSGALASLTEAAVHLQILQEIPEPKVNVTRTAATVNLAWIGLRDEFLELDMALDAAVRSTDQYTVLMKSGQGTTVDLVGLLLAMAWHGRILDDLKRHAEAREVFAVAISLARRNLAANEGSRDLRYSVARLLCWDARGAELANDLSDVHGPQIDEAVSMCAALHTDYPVSEGFQYNYCEALRIQGRISEKQDAAEAAKASYDQGVSLSQLLTEQSPLAGHHFLLAELLRDRAELAVREDRKPQAREDLTSALTAAGNGLKVSPESAQIKQLIADLKNRLTALE